MNRRSIILAVLGFLAIVPVTLNAQIRGASRAGGTAFRAAAVPHVTLAPTASFVASRPIVTGFRPAPILRRSFPIISPFYRASLFYSPLYAPAFYPSQSYAGAAPAGEYQDVAPIEQRRYRRTDQSSRDADRGSAAIAGATAADSTGAQSVASDQSCVSRWSSNRDSELRDCRRNPLGFGRTRFQQDFDPGFGPGSYAKTECGARRPFSPAVKVLDRAGSSFPFYRYNREHDFPFAYAAENPGASSCLVLAALVSRRSCGPRSPLAEAHSTEIPATHALAKIRNEAAATSLYPAAVHPDRGYVREDEGLQRLNLPADRQPVRLEVQVIPIGRVALRRSRTLLEVRQGGWLYGGQRKLL